MEYMKIGQVAKIANVSIDAIRYYERQGLIPHPPRGESGYRQYTEDSAKRLLFIKRAQELGFSLKEISELLSLRVDSKASCEDVRLRTENKIQDIDEKIQTLKSVKSALVSLKKHCHTNKSTSECPVLEALDSDVLFRKTREKLK